jgi:hypothetical protein
MRDTNYGQVVCDHRDRYLPLREREVRRALLCTGATMDLNHMKQGVNYQWLRITAHPLIAPY